jgi:hypothetical protein
MAQIRSGAYGLPTVRTGMSLKRIAAFWAPGKSSCYHATTIGTEELEGNGTSIWCSHCLLYYRYRGQRDEQTDKITTTHRAISL